MKIKMKKTVKYEIYSMKIIIERKIVNYEMDTMIS